MKIKITRPQEKIFNFSKLNPNDPSYNITFLYAIEGNLDFERFKNIFEMCINKIDLSKVDIKVIDNNIYNNCDEARKVKIESIDCLDMNEKEFEKFISDKADYLKAKPKDLSEWPLIDVYLLKNSETKYGLLLNMSHIISDVYSCYYLISLISKYYNSDLEENKIDAELNNDNFGTFLSYADKREEVDGDALEFFENEFRDISSYEIKEIIQARNNKGVLDGGKCSFKLNKQLSDRVRNFVSENKISEFAFFMSCYALIMSKMIKNNDIVTGIPLGNRMDKKIRNVFGYFVNTLPAHIVIDQEQSFSEFCDYILKKTYKIMKYQSFQLEQMEHKISGYINNVFTYYKQPLNFDLHECKVNRMPVNNSCVMFELTGVVESGEEFGIEFEYGTFFDNVDFEEVYIQLLNQVLENEQIGKITLVTNPTDEYLKINSYSEYKLGRHVKDIFEGIADKFSDRIAVKCNLVEWTYSELDKKSNQVAHMLLEKYPSDKCIAFSSNRRNELIAIIMGIIKAGKTYVPIDTVSPAKRVEYILNDLGQAPFIAEKEIIESLKFANDKVMYMDYMLENLDSYSDSRIDNSIEIKNPLYMIYTSGSTGNPKGVIVNNYNLVSLLESTKDKYNFNEKDIWTLFHSYGFDFSVWEIFGCLLFGGKLIIIDSLVCKSPEQFYNIVSEEKVTVLNQTPTAFKGFINADLELHKKKHE